MVWEERWAWNVEHQIVRKRVAWWRCRLVGLCWIWSRWREVFWLPYHVQSGSQFPHVSFLHEILDLHIDRLRQCYHTIRLEVETYECQFHSIMTWAKIILQQCLLVICIWHQCLIEQLFAVCDSSMILNSCQERCNNLQWIINHRGFLPSWC